MSATAIQRRHRRRRLLSALLEGIGESDTLVAGHLETILRAPLAWNATELLVAATERFPSPTWLGVGNDRLEVERLDASSWRILQRPGVLPSSPTHEQGARVVDVGRNYSVFDHARRQVLLGYAENRYLTRVGENHGIPRAATSEGFTPSDERFRAYLQVVQYLRAGPRWGIQRALAALLAPVVRTATASAATPARLLFDELNRPPRGIGRTLVRVGGLFYRIRSVSPDRDYIDLDPRGGPAWVGASFETDVLGAEVELLPWFVYELPWEPGRFYIDLYEVSTDHLPWGAFYLEEGGLGGVEPSTAQLLEDETVENVPAGEYWPAYLTSYEAVLTESGFLDIVRAMGMLPSVRTVGLWYESDPIEEELMGLFHGGYIARTGNRTLSLTPKNGLRDHFHCWVKNVGAPTDWQKVEVAAALTLDLDTLGAGGRDAGTLGAGTNNKIFLLYLIAQANLANPRLLAARDNVVPTLPGGYLYCSRPMGWMRLNGSSNFVLFKHSQDGWFEQTVDATVLLNFTATTPTALVCTDKLPNDQGSGNQLCDRVRLLVDSEGAEGTTGTREVLWAHDSGVTDVFATGHLTTDPDDADVEAVLDAPTGFRALATTFYAQISGAINGNIDVYALGGRVPGWVG